MARAQIREIGPSNVPGPGWSLHRDAAIRIEPLARFLVQDRTQRSRELAFGNLLESQSRVERHVPRHVPKRGERDAMVPVRRGPRADRHHEPRAEAAAPVIGMHVELHEVCRARLDQLYVCETNRGIAGESQPEQTAAMRRGELCLTRRLAQNTFGRLPREESGGSELDRWQSRDVARTRCRDLVFENRGEPVYKTRR